MPFLVDLVVTRKFGTVARVRDLLDSHCLGNCKHASDVPCRVSLFAVRFNRGREHHDGCRSPGCKPLVESSIESFSKLMHDFESVSRLKTYGGRSVIQPPTFHKCAFAQ